MISGCWTGETCTVLGLAIVINKLLMLGNGVAVNGYRVFFLMIRWQTLGIGLFDPLIEELHMVIHRVVVLGRCLG